MANLAAERAKNLMIARNEDNLRDLGEEELNRFLNDLADPGYKNTLYYI